MNIRNLFKVNIKDVRTKLMNIFHILLWCFHCWLWTSKLCRLGSVICNVKTDSSYMTPIFYWKFFYNVSYVLLKIGSWRNLRKFTKKKLSSCWTYSRKSSSMTARRGSDYVFVMHDCQGKNMQHLFIFIMTYHEIPII